jgi:uncharacterized DUF497 family protein
MIRFVWDANKAAANLRKHRVGFPEATEVFLDSDSISYPDEAHSTSEDRLLTLGKTKKLRVVVVVHTETIGFDEDVIIRIISARKATPSERSTYEQG